MTDRNFLSLHLHAFVAHRPVFGGVRLDLRAVERDMSQLRKLSFSANLSTSEEQPSQRHLVTLSKSATVRPSKQRRTAPDGPPAVIGRD